MFLKRNGLLPFKGLQVAVFAVFYILAGAANLAKAQGTIKIGLVVPLHGPLAPVGKDFLAGAQLAIDIANQRAVKANPAKPKFELLVENDEVNHPQYKMWLENLAQQFEQKKVLTIIGHLSTQSSWQASKVYQAKSMPFISPLSSYQGLTLQGLNTSATISGTSTFRLVPTDAQLAHAMAKHVLQNPKKQSIVVWHDGSVYGQTLATQFSQSLLPYSRIQLVGLPAKQQAQGIFHDDFDLRHQLQLFTSNGSQQKFGNESNNGPKIDAIFIGATQDKVIALKKVMNQFNLQIPLYAVSIASKEYIDWTLSSASITTPTGSKVPSAVSVESWPMVPHAATKKILAKRLEAQNHRMLMYAPYGFDAVNTVIAAYRQSPNNQSSQFLKQLGLVRHNGLTGTISFDANGDLKQPRFYFYQVNNNQWLKL
jgi:branched-chain amino acid transport system substrate-binding protein